MIDGILGGLAVGLGTVAYMMTYNGTEMSTLIATLCFAIVMLAIPFYKLDFFLGRPGVLSDKNNNIIDNLVVLAGNAIGVTWIALLLKLFPEYHTKIQTYAHYTLEHLHGYTWDTVFILSIFAGMMLYAGAMATTKGATIFYFGLVVFVTCYAQWPILHLIIFCLWSDTWLDYWYLLIPTTLGNVIGVNLWIMFRKHSPTYQNAKYVTRERADIADKFHSFV
jgi:formate/nitrite transporter FocA (FNT family)